MVLEYVNNRYFNLTVSALNIPPEECSKESYLKILSGSFKIVECVI